MVQCVSRRPNTINHVHGRVGAYAQCVMRSYAQTGTVEQFGKIKNGFSKDEALYSQFSPSTILNRSKLESRVQVSDFDSMNSMCSKTKTQQSGDHANKIEQQRLLFQKARDHLNPGPFFRFVTYFYAERKIAMFLLIHAVCTLVIWGKSQQIDLLNQTKMWSHSLT
jgi:hypothetical protein